MSEDIDSKIGRCLVIECEYLNEKDEIPQAMWFVRENHLEIKRNHICYSISIRTYINRKTVKIEANKESELRAFFDIAMNVFRFENLFDGLFFRIYSLNFDGEELYDTIKGQLLGYLKGNKNTAVAFSISLDDKRYRHLFSKFEKFLKDNILRHHIYIYSVFLMDVPADLRLAQMLEIFEPIADELSKQGAINYPVNTINLKPIKCDNCGFEIKRSKKRDIVFKDKLYALVKRYGKDVFKGDAQAKIVKKAVDTRNRIDHVNNKKNSLSGIHCATYLYKFSLLYRIIVLEQIGVDYSEIKAQVVDCVTKFNHRYDKYRIKW